jgi:hypothetical protein
MVGRLGLGLVGLALCVGLEGSAWAQVDVLTQHNNNQRTGANLEETVLSPASVTPQSFGMIAKRQVDDQVYGQPLIATGVQIGGGMHDLAIVTTVKNSVYAFDANDSARVAPLWHVNFGTPANAADGDFDCTDINGDMGIIGAPVLNPAKTALYVVALTKVRGQFLQRLHALDPSTGADLAFSPVDIQAAGFDTLRQNQRPALFLANGNIYVGYASHCDFGSYHGFLFGYDEKTLEQTAMFNSSPGGNGASIWQSGQAPAVDPAGNIYFITSNGSWNGVDQFSESFVKLDANLKLLDWFTPTNHALLDEQDLDLNSGGATLIPGTKLVVGGGKQGVLYSLNTEQMGHLGDEQAVQHFQATGSHLHSVVFWNSAAKGPMIYMWGQQERLRAYRLQGEKFDDKPAMSRMELNEGHPGAMLSLSANGNRDGILWASIHWTGDSMHESRPGILHAYNAADLSHELWNSHGNRKRDDCNNYSKMAPPTIANGKVYLASFGTENVGSGQMCVYGLLPNGSPPAAPSQVRLEVLGKRVHVAWEPVAGAEMYSIVRRRYGQSEVIASGVTSLEFSDRGSAYDKTDYRVVAVNHNGSSAESAAAAVPVAEDDDNPAPE